MARVRGETVRARLSALSAAGLDVDSFSSAATELIGQAVPFEYACLATTDPATRLITGTAKSTDADTRDDEFARFEYEVDDVNQFDEIARREVPVGVLDLDTDGRPERSARFREFLVPHFSWGHELRAAFRSGDAVWGLLGIYRPAGSGGFSPAEADFVAGVAPAVTAGIRAGLISSAATAPTDVGGPAVLVVGADDQVAQVTPAADARMAQLSGGRGLDDGAPLPMAVRSIVGAARAFGSGRTAVAPRSRVRTADGQWLVVSAAPLENRDGSRGDVVVTVEEARAPDVLPLLMAGFGLTPRERDVVERVLRGADTAEIARALHLSPYTVQDHLKAVFVKAGVTSRRELSARIFVEHYAPRLGSARAADGWFAID